MLAFLARPLSSEYLLGRDEGGLAGYHKVNSRGKVHNSIKLIYEEVIAKVCPPVQLMAPIFEANFQIST